MCDTGECNTSFVMRLLAENCKCQYYEKTNAGGRRMRPFTASFILRGHHRTALARQSSVVLHRISQIHAGKA